MLVLCDSRYSQQAGLTDSEGLTVSWALSKLSLPALGNTLEKDLSTSASRGQCTHKSTLPVVSLTLVSLASVLKFFEWFMFRISSTDRTGNWLGGTVVNGVLSKSLDQKYVLP